MVSNQSFDLPESSKAASDNILTTDDHTRKLASAQNVSLSVRSLLFIKCLLDNQSTTETSTMKNDDNLVSKSRVNNVSANDH